MILAVYLVLSFMVGMAANNHRGRSAFGWFLLSLLISPLISGILLLASKDLRKAVTVRTDGADEKKCPECAEMVKTDAKICRYCRHVF